MIQPARHCGRWVPGSLCVVVHIYAAGCGGIPDPKSEGIPLEDMPAMLAKAVCPRAYECCTTMHLENNQLAGSDPASCEVETRKSFTSYADAIASSHRKGRLVYRGVELAACLAHISAASCQELNRTNHLTGVTCPAWIEPRVSQGGVCGMDAECVAGFCEKAEKAPEGRCRALSDVGQTCAAPDRCTKGLHCDGTVQTCFQPAAQGEACTAGVRCASGNCEAGAGGGTGTCGPRMADTCFYSSACALGPGASPTPLGAAGFVLLALHLVLRRSPRRAASSSGGRRPG